MWIGQEPLQSGPERSKKLQESPRFFHQRVSRRDTAPDPKLDLFNLTCRRGALLSKQTCCELKVLPELFLAAGCQAGLAPKRPQVG